MRLLAPLFFALLMFSGLACAKSQPVALAALQDPADQFTVAGGVIHTHFTGDWKQLPRADVDRWIHTATNAVTRYFDHFPVKRLDLNIRLKDGNRVEGGVTYDGRRIDISVGTNTPAEYLDADWTLTHEMFHLAFPDLDESHKWMNEGLSTYLEPIARVRLGNMSVDQFWRETVAGMHDGLPEPGDQGLDRTHTWGRTYWGGALFWFIADLHIREQTDGRKSLDDAIRAILTVGGDGSTTWKIAKVVDVGDQATGTHVLRDQYKQMAQTPVAPDLDALWRKLGVRINGENVTYDDHAPLAAARIGLTKRNE